MNFKEALELLKEGKRVISKKDKEAWENSWLSTNEEGVIEYMNEPWTPTPDWLLDYMADEWINVEDDCDYHDQHTPTCLKVIK
jgi:hypothetical protein